mmetsp:Transcript_7024/g.12971  ORF Transcript_7024/g.12971 Transcript_7024/m.12971 type:complete len:232 (-) Transcript_7024:406-1101(-)
MVYNKLADFCLGCLASMVALDLVSVKIGVALKSLLAVGGLSSLVVALAMREPITNLVFGLLVAFSDKFQPGDKVGVGGGVGVKGVVTEMGWFHTKVRKADETTVIIPNAKILNEVIVNHSRQTWGQYETTIRLRYADIDKVEAVCERVRSSLSAMSPSVVVPPTRSVECFWKSFAADHLELSIDVRFRARGGSTRYTELREKANVRIAKAVKDCGAEFALPGPPECFLVKQ